MKMSNRKNEREPWRLECEKAEEEREREELTNKLNESLKKLDSYEEAEKEWLTELFMEQGIYQ